KIGVFLLRLRRAPDCRRGYSRIAVNRAEKTASEAYRSPPLQAALHGTYRRARLRPVRERLRPRFRGHRCQTEGISLPAKRKAITALVKDKKSDIFPGCWP